MNSERNLPKLSDLYDGDLELKQDQNQLNILLNQHPKSEWIRVHPTATGVKYIPIERIEYLLTRLFIKWWVEIKSIQSIANSVVVIIRLHYQNIENNEWGQQDGIGAAPIQTEKGSGAMEWDKVKSAAVMMAAPAAESFAIKDAAEKLGKIFGKDLNRKDEIIYDSLDGAIPERISISQIGYATELIRTSTLDCDQQERLETELQRPDLSLAEFQAIRNELLMNQPRKY